MGLKDVDALSDDASQPPNPEPLKDPNAQTGALPTSEQQPKVKAKAKAKTKAEPAAQEDSSAKAEPILKRPAASKAAAPKKKPDPAPKPEAKSKPKAKAKQVAKTILKKKPAASLRAYKSQYKQTQVWGIKMGGSEVVRARGSKLFARTGPTCFLNFKLSQDCPNFKLSSKGVSWCAASALLGEAAGRCVA